MSHVHLSAALVLALLVSGPLHSQEPADGSQPQTAVVPFSQNNQLPVTIHPAPNLPKINVYRQPPVVSVEGAQGPTPAYSAPTYQAPQCQGCANCAGRFGGQSVVVQNTPPIPTRDAFVDYMKHKILFNARFRKGLLPRRYVVRRDAAERQIQVLRFFHNYEIVPRQ